MAKTKLEKFLDAWRNHWFSSGPYPGEDYLKFERAFRGVLKEVGEQANCDLFKFNKNHYECSAVLKARETGLLVYVSISDVRFFQGEWYSHILYRQMKDETDWSGKGGPNRYSTLTELSGYIARLVAIG